MKKGFSLIMAIFFVILIATLGMMSMSLSSKMVKQSGDVYLKEQAELYAMSATSLAVLDMQGTDYSKDCLTEKAYDFGDGFTAGVSIFYLDSNMPATCNARHKTAGSQINIRDMDLKDASGNDATFYNVAILDVIVTNTDGIEPIRYHRRTVQRPWRLV